MIPKLEQRCDRLLKLQKLYRAASSGPQANDKAGGWLRADGDVKDDIDISQPQGENMEFAGKGNC